MWKTICRKFAYSLFEFPGWCNMVLRLSSFLYLSQSSNENRNTSCFLSDMAQYLFTFPKFCAEILCRFSQQSESECLFFLSMIFMYCRFSCIASSVLIEKRKIEKESMISLNNRFRMVFIIVCNCFYPVVMRDLL